MSKNCHCKEKTVSCNLKVCGEDLDAKCITTDKLEVIKLPFEGFWIESTNDATYCETVLEFRRKKDNLNELEMFWYTGTPENIRQPTDEDINGGFGASLRSSPYVGFGRGPVPVHIDNDKQIQITTFAKFLGLRPEWTFYARIQDSDEDVFWYSSEWFFILYPRRFTRMKTPPKIQTYDESGSNLPFQANNFLDNSIPDANGRQVALHCNTILAKIIGLVLSN